MESANSDTKKSRLLIFMLVGLLAAAAVVGVLFYQSSHKHTDAAAEVETVDTDHTPESAEAPAKQSQPKKKPVAQKQESGSVLDKLKAVDVHGAKNPCTETQRMMKQCSD